MGRWCTLAQGSGPSAVELGDLEWRADWRAFAGAALLLGTLPLLVACDHGLEATAPEGAGIAGRVTFVGTWPEGVGQVAVAVYERPPQVPEDFLSIRGWDTSVPVGAEAYDYEVPLAGGGTYRWVVVAWRASDRFWDFTSLMGCFHASGDSLPGAVAVADGRVARGVDITVDFALLTDGHRPGEWVCERGLSTQLLELASGP